MVRARELELDLQVRLRPHVAWRGEVLKLLDNGVAAAGTLQGAANRRLVRCLGCEAGGGASRPGGVSPLLRLLSRRADAGTHGVCSLSRRAGQPWSRPGPVRDGPRGTEVAWDHGQDRH